MRAPIVFIGFSAFLTLGSPVVAQNCRGTFEHSDEYAFGLSSSTARRGEIVPVDIRLSAELIQERRVNDVTVLLCFDPELVQPEGPVVLSEFMNEAASRTLQFRLDGTIATSPNWGEGLLLSWGIHNGNLSRVLESGMDEILATVFFRVLAEVNDQPEIALCDDFTLLAIDDCQSSWISYHATDDLPFQTVVSTRNQSGFITVEPGPPINVDLPDLPPVAKVYPEAPTTEEAAVLFELLPRAPLAPGEVAPVELWLTSAYEPVGFSASITFPADSLRVADIRWEGSRGSEDLRRDGHLVLLLLDGIRRLSEENERVRVATIDFALVDGVPIGEDSIDVRLEDLNEAGTVWQNEILVRAERGDALPDATARVEPIELVHGQILPASRGARVGDVNRSGAVDISDAVAILRYLFAGAEVDCVPAADFDASGDTNVTDAIAVLDWLFRGGGDPMEPVVACGS